MKKMLANKVTASVVLGTALLGGAVANAAVNDVYVKDARGVIVRDNFNECLRTGYWVPELAIAECDPSLVKKPAPAPAPVVVAPPPPPPAPVVEVPAPVVAPVVVAPPPPPPAPVFKTVTTEKKLTLEGTSFDSGSAKLKAAANEKLAEAVAFAGENKDSNLVITGYTDSQGAEKNNVVLSAARANAVKAYLVKKGVAASRLSTKGMGSANPVGDNKTAAGRAANRRVEIDTSVMEEKKVRVN